MEFPLVSWLIPVHNGERHICRALDSVLGQTYTHFQVILLLEGCTDQTGRICAEYAQRDPRIYIHASEERLGVAASLNRGLALCRGKYAARMDADDISYPHRLQKQVAYMETHPDVVVLGSQCRMVYGESSWKSLSQFPLEHEQISAALLFGNALAHPTVLFRLEPFRRQHWQYPPGEAEDYALWGALAARAKMACLPDVLLDYHVHDMQASSVRQQAVKLAARRISRGLFADRLHLDTSAYADAHFGGYFDSEIPADIPRFLADEARLLRDVERANAKLKAFPDRPLRDALLKQWQRAKAFARVDTLFDGGDACSMPGLDGEIRHVQSLYFGCPDVIVYATGAHCLKQLQSMPEGYPFRIIAFTDTDVSKHGTVFLGKPIIPPEALNHVRFDYVMIASPAHYWEIKSHLLNAVGIARHKILRLPPAADMAFHLRRARFSRFLAHPDTARRAFLFCAPDYGNLGDHAIALSARQFISDRFNMEVIEIPFSQYGEIAMIAKRFIRPTDILFITGGGFFGSLWFAAEAQARAVITEYPKNPIVVLPQTLYWEDTPIWQAERERTRAVYAKHPALLLCARDEESLGLMRSAYPECRVSLIPDMTYAHDWAKDFPPGNRQRKGALICLKTDWESILTKEDRAFLYCIGEEVCGSARICETDLFRPISVEQRAPLLQEVLEEFAACELVLTDRLHGLIFAAITRTPCVALNNCNHKLRANYQWVKDAKNIRFAEDIQSVRALAEQVLQDRDMGYDPKALSPFFDNLQLFIQATAGL